LGDNFIGLFVVYKRQQIGPDPENSPIACRLPPMEERGFAPLRMVPKNSDPEEDKLEAEGRKREDFTPHR
jgi:hypothetical protein